MKSMINNLSLVEPESQSALPKKLQLCSRNSIGLKHAEISVGKFDKSYFTYGFLGGKTTLPLVNSYKLRSLGNFK
jgi:hypothetical protein